MKPFQTAAVSAPRGGRLVEAFGTNLIRIASGDTGDRLALMEVTLAPGEGTPLHVHDREDEAFRVLRGTLRFHCGSEVFVLGEGGMVALPRGIPHKIQNIGDAAATALVILTPGGFENFFVETSQDPSGDVNARAARFGLRFVAD